LAKQKGQKKKGEKRSCFAPPKPALRTWAKEGEKEGKGKKKKVMFDAVRDHALADCLRKGEKKKRREKRGHPGAEIAYAPVDLAACGFADEGRKERGKERKEKKKRGKAPFALLILMDQREKGEKRKETWERGQGKEKKRKKERPFTPPLRTARIGPIRKGV